MPWAVGKADGGETGGRAVEGHDPCCSTPGSPPKNTRRKQSAQTVPRYFLQTFPPEQSPSLCSACSARAVPPASLLLAAPSRPPPWVCPAVLRASAVTDGSCSSGTCLPGAWPAPGSLPACRRSTPSPSLPLGAARPHGRLLSLTPSSPLRTILLGRHTTSQDAAPLTSARFPLVQTVLSTVSPGDANSFLPVRGSDLKLPAPASPAGGHTDRT